MQPVDVTVELDAPPDAVFELLLDMSRTPEWVTICREVLSLDAGTPHPGWRCKQRYALRGAPFVVSWVLDELTPNQNVVWKGRGPARSRAEASQELTPLDGGRRTRLRYRNAFKTPGGPFGAVASRALMGDVAEVEARRSLENLAGILRADDSDRAPRN